MSSIAMQSTLSACSCVAIMIAHSMSPSTLKRKSTNMLTLKEKKSRSINRAEEKSHVGLRKLADQETLELCEFCEINEALR